jgi:aryl-alcohol dehydrogenase-like predicted oxidoreductase/enamine deaminase RidA (YjgF/YER057c/UK114 family)
MAVERIALSPDLEISRVLTGLWQIADLERAAPLDLRETALRMTPYVRAGLTTFDMADHYGSAEEIVGLFAADDATPIQALTKWVPPPGPTSAAEVRAAVEKALRRLKTDRLDLLQFHAWSYWDPSYVDTLFHLQDLRREGLVANLGLTNCDTAHLRLLLASGIEIVSNQVCFSLLDRRPLAGMTELCAEHGVGLLAYGTLAGGLLTERWLGRARPEAFDTWSQMKYARFIDAAGGWDRYQGVLRAVSGIAQRLSTSIAAVASRYVLDQTAVAGVVVGARLGKSEHIEDTLGIFDLKLDEESHEELEAALARLDPIPGDCGDEYRRPPYLTASGDLSHHLDELPSAYAVDTDARGRARVTSGTFWEEKAGYSRAVRLGNRILVSGTTATHGDRALGGADPAAQAHFVIDKIEGAIRALGGTLDDVVRTRVYVPHEEHCQPVAEVHGERFGHVRPANTLILAKLVGDEYLVEMEAEAVVDAAGS